MVSGSWARLFGRLTKGFRHSFRIGFPGTVRCRCRLSSLLPLLAPAVFSCASAEAASPAEASIRLYAILDALGLQTMPDARELAAMEPFITASLADGLQRAAAGLANCSVGGRPDPHSAAGARDVFSSFFDGRTGGRPDTTLGAAGKVEGDTSLVVMAFSNTDQKPQVQWADTIVVLRTHNNFLVADIHYGQQWEFGFSGRLSEVLERYASGNCSGEAPRDSIEEP